MKSKLFTRISLCLLTLISSGSILGMGGYYTPEPKAVTTEEKINHYLYYLATHGITSLLRHGKGSMDIQSIGKVVPELFERVLVDGARMVIPDAIGAKTPAQKRLVNLGIEGARQAIRFSSDAQEYAKEQGKKLKRSDAIKIFMTKKFVPSLVKSLVVDLMYQGGGIFANSLVRKFGYDPKDLAASQFTIPGMIYQQARAGGYDACSGIYDLLFARS